MVEHFTCPNCSNWIDIDIHEFQPENWVPFICPHCSHHMEIFIQIVIESRALAVEAPHEV